jgi:peptide deformylase
MILPIVAYGDKVLREICDDIDANYQDLKDLIKNMWDTMYNANGVGLAAPQINKDVRLFIVDSKAMYDEGEEHLGIKKVFINATILEESGEEWAFEEGCLSIPNVREDVLRKPNIKIEYYDEKFKKHVEDFDGMNARVIQHEYDHVEGILFTDHIKPLKKKLLHKILSDISRGFTNVKYKMRFPNKK